MQYTHLKHGLNIRAIRACGFALLAACAGTAWAMPGPEPEQARETPAAVPASAAAATSTDAPQGEVAAQAQQHDAPALASLDFGPAADLGKLEASRGGTDVHNDMKLDGVVSGNSAINVITGSNTIDAGAFANMSGIPVVIQNSGANVLIQNATIVNLQFK